MVAACASAADTRELQQRRQRAAAAFSDGILLLHARFVPDYTSDGFRQDPGFYYFTGLANTVGAILAIDGRSREIWLFLPTHAPLGSLEGSSTSDAVKHTGIEHVSDWSELASFLQKYGSASTTLYYAAVAYSVPDLPPNIIGDTSHPQSAPAWALALAQKWPSFHLQEARERVNALMDVQSLSELADVRSAAKATVAAVMAGIRAIRPGVSQRSVEAAVEDTCWKEGAHGSSFWPWAMAGINSVFPKPFASMTRYDHLNGIMNAGDLVRLDVGCEWNYYRGRSGRRVRCRATTMPTSARSGTSLSPRIMRARNSCGKEPP